MKSSLLAFFTISLLSAPGLAKPLVIEMEAAADHHVSAQGDYRGGLAQSWEYNFGSSRSAPNITGIVASGLLAAFKLTGLQEHEESALRAARSLISAYDRGWRKQRPVTQDIEFLVNAGFMIDAARWFKVTRGSFNPAAYVSMVLERRVSAASVGAWDVASAIRAALGVGEIEYARGLLRALLEKRAVWDRADRGPGQRLARGSLIWAMGELRDRAGLTVEEQQLAANLVSELSAEQSSSGGWQDLAGGVLCTQTTAYATLGLSRWASGNTASAKGRAWLRRMALTDQKFFVGGRIWATTYKSNGAPENNYNSEVQSEVMMALASAR
jgi:hypothetical protein